MIFVSYFRLEIHAKIFDFAWIPGRNANPRIHAKIFVRMDRSH